MTAFCDPLYDFRNSEDPEYCLLQKLEGTGTSYTSSDQTCICQWAFQSIALQKGVMKSKFFHCFWTLHCHAVLVGIIRGPAVISARRSRKVLSLLLAFVILTMNTVLQSPFHFFQANCNISALRKALPACS